MREVQTEAQSLLKAQYLGSEPGVKESFKTVSCPILNGISAHIVKAGEQHTQTTPFQNICMYIPDIYTYIMHGYLEH